MKKLVPPLLLLSLAAVSPLDAQITSATATVRCMTTAPIGTALFSGVYTRLVLAWPGAHLICRAFYDDPGSLASLLTRDEWSFIPSTMPPPQVLIQLSQRVPVGNGGSLIPEVIPQVDLDVLSGTLVGTQGVIQYVARSVVTGAVVTQAVIKYGKETIGSPGYLFIGAKCPPPGLRVGPQQTKYEPDAATYSSQGCLDIRPNPGFVTQFGNQLLSITNRPASNTDYPVWTTLGPGQVLITGTFGDSALVSAAPGTPAPSAFIVLAGYAFGSPLSPWWGQDTVWVQRPFFSCELHTGWHGIIKPGYFTSATDLPDEDCEKMPPLEPISTTAYCTVQHTIPACVSQDGTVSQMISTKCAKPEDIPEIIICPNPTQADDPSVPGIPGSECYIDPITLEIVCPWDATPESRPKLRGKLRAKTATDYPLDVNGGEVYIAIPNPPAGQLDWFPCSWARNAPGCNVSVSDAPVTLSGTVTFTGYAASMVTVAYVKVVRETTAADQDSSVNPNSVSDGLDLIPMADTDTGGITWLPGTRTDSAFLYPNWPNNDLGWSYALDTTTLANGTYTLHFLAGDTWEQVNGIGTVTFTVAN